MQWQRRPSEQEYAVLVAASEQHRLLAGVPVGEWPAPPSADDITIAVLACRDHAIGLDDAARVHAAGCPAPHPDHLPACGCSPEELPPPVPIHTRIPTVTLPTGWSLPV